MHNARRNGLPIEGLTLDWRRPAARRFDVILGCEVIYDAALHDPLLATLATMLAPGGTVWLADHGRMHTPAVHPGGPRRPVGPLNFWTNTGSH